MIQLDKRTERCDASEAQAVSSENHISGFPLPQKRKAGIRQMRGGLVVSSDHELRRRLGEIARRCNFATMFAATVAEAGVRLYRHRPFLVVCQDHLPDGKYDAIVKMAHQASPTMPVIVLSRTGDWPEYLTGIRVGAFDYVAYPPIPGELERIIENVILEFGRRQGTRISRYPDRRAGEPWGPGQ